MSQLYSLSILSPEKNNVKDEKRSKNKCKSIKRKCLVFKCFSFDSFMSGVLWCNEWRTNGCKKFIITGAIESVNYCFCFPFVSDDIAMMLSTDMSKKMLNYLRFTCFYSYADWWFVFWPLFNCSFVIILYELRYESTLYLEQKFYDVFDSIEMPEMNDAIFDALLSCYRTTRITNTKTKECLLPTHTFSVLKLAT